MIVEQNSKEGQLTDKPQKSILFCWKIIKLIKKFIWF